ncbi:hypothetical protein PHET_04464, partial [Paragonimus heterotremus]
SVNLSNFVNGIDNSEKNQVQNKNVTLQETVVDILSLKETENNDSHYVIEPENAQVDQTREDINLYKTNQHTTYKPTNESTEQQHSSLSLSDNINFSDTPGLNSNQSVVVKGHILELPVNQSSVLHATEDEKIRNHVNSGNDGKVPRPHLSQTSEGRDPTSSPTLFTPKHQSELEIILPKQIRPADFSGSDNTDEIVAKLDERQTLSKVPNSQEKHRLRVACYQRPVIQLCHTKTEYQNGYHSLGIRTSQLTWYYDPVEMTCQHTSDCILNGNAFATRAECERVCIPISGARRCLAPPKAGYFQCSEQGPSRTVVPILMVFFDKTTGKCRWFTYYGCGGTANRFQSIAECQATCNDRVASKIFTIASELCQIAPSVEQLKSWPMLSSDSHSSAHSMNTSDLEETASDLFDDLTFAELRRPESGCANVGQFESRWYMDARTGICKEFSFSHCGGSANNFLTRTDCERFCSAKTESPLDFCMLKPDPGECNSKKQMWYFNPELAVAETSVSKWEKGGCQLFTYSGCGGNNNRFADRDTCETTCSVVRLLLHSTEPSGVTDSPTISKTSISPDTISQITEDKSDSLSVESGKDDLRSLDIFSKSNAQVNDSQRNDRLHNIDLEPCRRPVIVGNCRPLNCTLEMVSSDNNCTVLQLQRWFFNAHTSNCEPFRYSGCGGSENTFDDAQSCQVACKARIVRPDRDRRCDSLPHQNKCYAVSLSGTPGREQKDNLIAFHFSVGSATCKAFHLDTSRSGCSMKPYFANGQECLHACVKSTPTEQHLQNRCFARKTHATWNCSSGRKTFRWSYLSELNQCVQFSQCVPQMGDFEQPGNNFASRAICETTCMANSLEEVCQLPMDRGPCGAHLPRYYYNPKSSECQMFLYGGCLGNANRFISRQECQTACAEFHPLVLRQNWTAENAHSSPASKAPDAIIPSVSADVFDLMRAITLHHTEHFPWDFCLENHSYGTCAQPIGYHHASNWHVFKQLTRFYYDRRLGKCQPFTYTGCGARGNHFDTLADCVVICEDRLLNSKSVYCPTINETKQCPGSGIHAWAFNRSVGDCHAIELCSTQVPVTSESNKSVSDVARLRRIRHWLGGLQEQTTNRTLPLGVHATRIACQFHCSPKPPRGTDVQNVCHMNPIVTVPFGCNAMITRWYFEPREATCRSYVTCPQYGNNFPSEKACRDICAPTHPLDVCRLPRDHGGCSKFITRWYYHLDTRTCRPFLYGGCFGNSNRFLSKAECDSFCSAQDVCRLPPQKSSSDSTYPKHYYYNLSTRQCTPFHFTGILAHGNNFPSLEACNATCLFVPDIETVTLSTTDEDESKTDQVLSVNPDKQWKDIPHSTKDDVFTMNVSQTAPSRSPCTNRYSELGSTDLAKQSICDSEDIIHELGYRFRAVRSKNERDEEVEGFCELTLIPICLSEPKKVFGAIVDPMMRTIGRVFQTQSECEETCLANRRIRRSISSSTHRDENASRMERVVRDLLEQSGHHPDSRSNQSVRNGCSPEKALAEQVDHFQHQLQAYSRWPCKFDTEDARNQFPLHERLEGSEIWLPCWVISQEAPKMQWTRLKDKKIYRVTPNRMPALNNSWRGHLYLTRLDSLRHSGAWSCQAYSKNGLWQSEVFTQLHVIPRHFVRGYIPDRSISMISVSEQTINVPEGGTLLLGCRVDRDPLSVGYFYDEQMTWHRSKARGLQQQPVNLVSLTGVPLLYIRPVDAELHSGIWTCTIPSESDPSDEALVRRFFVSVGQPPKFEQVQPIHFNLLSKHRRTQRLQCGAADWGHPVGRLRWFYCRPTTGCKPLLYGPDGKYSEPTSLIVYPSPGDRYTCRIENQWGRVEQHFEFNTGR